MTLPAHPSLPRPAHWPAWALLLPKVGMGLLVIALGSLLYILHREEQEDQRAVLIADSLWIAENFRFHVEGVQEQLQQLAYDLSQKGGRVSLFELRAGHILKNNPGVAQLFWLDGEDRLIYALPNSIDIQREREALGEPARTSLAGPGGMARKLGKAMYGAPFLVPQHGAYFEVHVPIFRESRYLGMLIGTYSLDAMLTHLVPWWFAQKYQLRVVDENGLPLGSKTNVVGEPAMSYSIAFEPPGSGLRFEVVAYRAEGNSMQRILATTMVALAIMVIWSLWALRGHVRKRFQAEQALREEHAFRKAMEDSSIIGLRARDLTGRIIYVNPAFCRMVGYSAEELVGCAPPMPYWAPEEMDNTLRRHAMVLAGKAPLDGFEIRLMRKDGERFDALIYESALIDATGQHTGWMASLVDITDKKRAEALHRAQQEKLEQTARLVTMGEMASTLAHELNQPLAAISGYVGGCSASLEQACQETDPERLRARRQDIAAALEKISAQARRAGQIIRRIHQFVRKREARSLPCHLEEILDDALGLLEPEMQRQGVRVSQQWPAQLPPLEGDPVLLGQLFINLLRNGCDAMAGQPPERRQLRITVAQEGERVLVTVADQGSGLPQADVEQLFAPFFTTKPAGMGMGLSICRSIVEFHHGRLWAENLPGGGAAFHFTLALGAVRAG